MIRLLLLVFSAAMLSYSAPPDLSGKWFGELKNYPLRADAPSVTVRREIERFPEADSACSAFRTTYFENGVERAVKDYKFCRGKGADDFYIDEGDGTRLTARWLGDALIAPFKYDNLLLVSVMRLRGDVLEEEIFTIPDSDSHKGVAPLVPKTLQRLELRRTPQKP
jgi:hypothetical protein